MLKMLHVSQSRAIFWVCFFEYIFWCTGCAYTKYIHTKKGTALAWKQQPSIHKEREKCLPVATNMLILLLMLCWRCSSWCMCFILLMLGPHTNSTRHGCDEAPEPISPEAPQRVSEVGLRPAPLMTHTSAFSDPEQSRKGIENPVNFQTKSACAASWLCINNKHNWLCSLLTHGWSTNIKEKYATLRISAWPSAAARPRRCRRPEQHMCFTQPLLFISAPVLKG